MNYGSPIFLLPQRFRSIAAKAKISDMAAKDLKLEQLIPLVDIHLTNLFLNAIARGLDLNDIMCLR